MKPSLKDGQLSLIVSLVLLLVLLYERSCVINKNSLCFGLQVISQRNVAKFLKQAGQRDMSCFGRDKSLLNRFICEESQHVTVSFTPLYKCGHNVLINSNDFASSSGLASPVYLQLYL